MLGGGQQLNAPLNAAVNGAGVHVNAPSALGAPLNGVNGAGVNVNGALNGGVVYTYSIAPQ